MSNRQRRELLAALRPMSTFEDQILIGYNTKPVAFYASRATRSTVPYDEVVAGIRDAPVVRARLHRVR